MHPAGRLGFRSGLGARRPRDLLWSLMLSNLTAPEGTHYRTVCSCRVLSLATVTVEVSLRQPIFCQNLIHQRPVSTQAFTGAVPFSDTRLTTVMPAVMDGERPQRPTRSALTDGSWALIVVLLGPGSSLPPESCGSFTISPSLSVSR